MRSSSALIRAGVVASAILGCGNDATGPEVADIVGSWHATRAQITSVAHPASTIDIVAIGATLQIVFTANNTFTSTAAFPGEAAETTTGTYTVTAGKLTMTNDQNSGGDVLVFDIALSNGTLSLTGGAIDFDFGTGEEASKLDVNLVH